MSTHSRVGREHILNIAEKLFTEHGYKSASIRAIASECGVTNAAIYYHFPDKESLFVEVMQRHAENLREKMVQASANISLPREKIRAILNAYINAIAGQHAPAFMLHRDAKYLRKGPRCRGKLMHSISQPLVETLKSSQERGEIKKSPSADETAAILLGMLHGLAQQHRASGIEGRALSEDDIQKVVTLFWEGVKR